MTNANLLTSRDGNILTILFNREDKMNAMTASFLADLKAELDAVKYDDTVSVVVLKATGRAFTTGYDLDADDWILPQNPIELDGKLDLDRDPKRYGTCSSTGGRCGGSRSRSSPKSKDSACPAAAS